MKYEYETLKDHVSPDEADAFFASYKKADENLEYSLSKETDEAQVKKISENKSGRHVNLVYVVCLVGILFGGGVWWTQRRR